MKILKILVLITAGLLMVISCEESGGTDINDATSLGNTLPLTGTVDRVFDANPITVPWTTSYTNGGSNDYVLTDESDDTVYMADDNNGALVDVNLNYTGSTHMTHLYSSAGWPGVNSSNSSVQMTSIVVEVWNAAGDTATDNDLFLGNFSTSPAKWYYYMYATGETILNGTYNDTGDSTFHKFDNVRVFQGWNRMVKSTTDGVTFTYSGGEITDAHWTYIDNS